MGISVGFDLQALSQRSPLLLVRGVMKTSRAIAFCRVSTDEQLKNGSLTRQERSVIRTAAELEVEIPKEYWWSGSVSSKRGTNLERTDLKEALAVCSKDKTIKYAIVDEPDRFMRSINEAMYFEVLFQKLGVRVWYASDPDLNKDDMSSKLLKFLEYFKAEGSNEERQKKSIMGHLDALKEGRWTFQPKTGYRKGLISGVPEIDSTRGPLLQEAMLSIIEYRATPTEALKWLNTTDFVKNRPKYKMDKFRKVCTDPFYAGVVWMDKQVKYTNENGLHQPLLTMDQHHRLLAIFDKKIKNQDGPRKNGNPRYPLSNLISCDKCRNERYGRYAGVTIDNGVNKAKVYEKYRCRSCYKSLAREDMHRKINEYISQCKMTEESRNDLVDALIKVWDDRKKSVEVQRVQLAKDITILKRTTEDRVEAAILPSNESIKGDILRIIDQEKQKLSQLEQKYESLNSDNTAEKEKFLRFALERADNMSRYFTELPKDRILKCKQMLFPAGFWIDTNENVYTPEMSILYRLTSNKKDLPKLEKSSMVRVRRL